MLVELCKKTNLLLFLSVVTLHALSADMLSKANSFWSWSLTRGESGRNSNPVTKILCTPFKVAKSWRNNYRDKMFYDFPNYLVRIFLFITSKTAQKLCPESAISRRKIISDNSLAWLPFFDDFVSWPSPVLLRPFVLLPHSAFRSSIAPTVIL